MSFWMSVLPSVPPRAPLPGDVDADVAIVGAGYTGLWTAYYLAEADPALRVVVLEAETAGYGAAGRNGGWLSGFFSGPARAYERGRPAGSYARLQREMFATVDEVAAVLARHRIDAELIKGGVLTVALDRAQLERLREGIAAAHDGGLGEHDLRE